MQQKTGILYFLDSLDNAGRFILLSVFVRWHKSFILYSFLRKIKQLNWIKPVVMLKSWSLKAEDSKPLLFDVLANVVRFKQILIIKSCIFRKRLFQYINKSFLTDLVLLFF